MGHTLETAEKITAFLEALITHGGNISAACVDSELPRAVVYRMEKEDEEFASAFREAQSHGLKALEDEARRRAFAGTDKPVFYQGEQCGSVREYSDTLMIFLLKGGMPEKYQERIKHAGDPENPLAHTVKHRGSPAIMAFLEGLQCPQG